ncbi:MAG TPA: galactose-1-phosphate uridylyltransferase, partial [Pseudothermotoga sp.]|nr:galactose-1-phosphate uridylyltransferase [Pseudothermotoga sp.]
LSLHDALPILDGFGYHEVIIETPDHNTHLALMDYKQVEEVIWAYKQRFETIMKDSKIQYVLIFKNHGSDAGASLQHPHSQLIAIPTIPKRVQEELSGSQEYFSYKERCVFCDIIDQELQLQERIVEENEDFVSIEPFAARFPCETWIIPKRHSHDFRNILDKEIKSFSQILKNTLYKIYGALDNPPYNFMLHTAPNTGEGKNYYHWHLEIVPRLTKVAGFEWGSGFYINPMPPEEATKYLRAVEIP